MPLPMAADAYCPERAERLTRPASPGAAMHPRLDPAYLPRVDTFAAPTSYSPRRPGDSLQRGTSFSRGHGHLGTVPASHATGAATDGLGRWAGRGLRRKAGCCLGAGHLVIVCHFASLSSFSQV